MRVIYVSVRVGFSSRVDWVQFAASTSSDILGLAYPGDCYWGQSSTNGFLKIEYTGYGGMRARVRKPIVYPREERLAYRICGR
nr:hypothetical protein BaRGS_024224 [Batillaria attramentaria]